MTCSEIDVRLVAGITPDVIADGRVHIFARGIEIFLIAFDLVDESRFRDRYTDVILLAALLRGWRGRVGCKCPCVADRSLPKFTVRSARALAQFSELFVCNV